MRYWPSALVTVVRTTPVLVFVVVIVTPGRPASPGSSTRPLTVLVVCPGASPDESIRIDVASHTTRRVINASFQRAEYTLRPSMSLIITPSLSNGDRHALGPTDEYGRRGP